MVSFVAAVREGSPLSRRPQACDSTDFRRRCIPDDGLLSGNGVSFRRCRLSSSAARSAAACLFGM